MEWHNHEHRHSAIRFVTPAQRHEGLDDSLLEHRKAIYEAAHARHPQRWSGNTRNWRRVQAVHLNPDKTETTDENPKVVAIQDKIAA